VIAENAAVPCRRLSGIGVPVPTWLPVAGVSLAATVLSWRPQVWAKVAPGLDASWQSGLAEAFERHLHWGPQVIFTFGPYGFVSTLLPFYRTTALLAVLFALAVSWGLAALVVAALRPSVSLLPGGAVAWAVLAVANGRTGYPDLASVLALGLALRALWPSQASRGFVPLVLLGVLAGFLTLVKFNDGLVALGLLAVAVVARLVTGRAQPAGRFLLAGIVPMVASLLGAWAAAGQSFADLASYARGSLAIVAGYSSAMSLSEGRRAEDFFAVTALALLAVTFYLAARSRQLAPAAAACLAVALAGWAWAALKEGFVRHDAHDLTFFALVLLAASLAGVRRRYLLTQAGALAVMACFFGLAAGAVPPALHSPGASASAIATELKEVFGLGGFSRAQQQLRAELVAAGNSLPAQVLTMADDHSVAIVPSEEALAYVYQELDWDPEPVLQGYSAYTSYLDRLDASFLASARAPSRIFYQPLQVISGSNPWMSPPAALLAMYCHYVQAGAAGSWQVLSRTDGSRCGPARPFQQVRARFAQAVRVPRVPGEMVAATFSFSLPLTYAVAEVALRPPALHLEVWAAGATRPAIYRFVPGTAGDLHVLVTPPALGYSAAFAPPAVLKLALAGGGWAPGQGSVRVTFYAIKFQEPA
jgi:hypothetical protein